MFNEFICLFRRYCGLGQQEVADAAGMSIEKYRSYEYGLADPDEDALNRLSAVFGLKESVFSLGAQHVQKTFEMFEPRYADDNIFASAEDKAKVKLLLNMLEDEEILNIVEVSRDIGEMAEELVRAANEKGGRDNISVILIDPLA